MSQTTNLSGAAAPTAAPTDLTFEQAFERLQAIAARLNEEAVPVSEMCELFAEGKGLEIACTTFLETERGRIEAIERGEGIRAFRIRRAAAQTAPAPSAELSGTGSEALEL